MCYCLLFSKYVICSICCCLFSQNKFKKRAVVEMDDDELQEFMENVVEFKEGMESKVGNLTCILTQLNSLDSNMNINKDFFLNSMWEEYSSDGYARDPEFVDKVRTGFGDCYEIAESWPQASLNRNPITRKWGRHMVFFHCIEVRRWLAESELIYRVGCCHVMQRQYTAEPIGVISGKMQSFSIFIAFGSLFKNLQTYVVHPQTSS